MGSTSITKLLGHLGVTLMCLMGGFTYRKGYMVEKIILVMKLLAILQCPARHARVEDHKSET